MNEINDENLGKEARPELRATIRASAPEGWIGGCPECGDYMFEKDGKAVCCYCEHEIVLKNN